MVLLKILKIILYFFRVEKTNFNSKSRCQPINFKANIKEPVCFNFFKIFSIFQKSKKIIFIKIQ